MKKSKMFHVPVMDIDELVKKKLLPGHKLIVAAEAGLVQEFVKRYRVIALIEGVESASVAAVESAQHVLTASNKRSGAAQTGDVERAILVLRSNTDSLPKCPTLLKVETLLPVDARFKYNIDSPESKDHNFSFSDGTRDAVLLNLSSSRHQLLFEMTFSQKTNSFMSEVLKAAEGVSKKKAPTPEFTWLKPYLMSTSSRPSSSSSPGDHNQNSQIFTIEGNSSSCAVADLINISDNGGNEDDSYKNVGRSGNADSVCRKDDIDVKESIDHDRPPQPSPSSSAAATSHTKNVRLTNDSELLRIQDVTLNDSSAAQSTFCPGGTPVMARARESHVVHQMALRESSYTYSKFLTVFVGTWNVNGVPPSIGLMEWLAVDKDPPDVYALGFQELDLATEAYIFQASNREPEWRAAVLSSLHPAARYREVRLVRLVGMLLMVLVKEEHFKSVSRVQTCVVPTGIMNMIGNKGGVSVSLDLYNTSVCFVNCHLAAHVEEFERRNEDYACICEKTVFVGSNGLQKYINDHTQMYFFGDMNYRIVASPELNIRELASSGRYDVLLERDQLNLQRKKGKVFQNYKEGKIDFRPTFKYDKDTDAWDTSEKQRQPAWCDRVLWAGEGIEQRHYRVHMALKISDHKPVSAVFRSQVKVVDQSKYRKVHEEVMKQLDKMENDLLPSVSLSDSEINLGEVRFMEPRQASLTITNTGQINVQFSFIKKLEDAACFKPWLKAHPSAAFIMPGSDCTVQIEVKVDKSSASALNSGAEKLEDILVLHLDGGKDFFITVKGDYVRSCFGSSLKALVHLNKPFEEVPVAQLVDLESSAPERQLDMPYAVPKELWYLIDHLCQHGLDAEGLFSRAGPTKELCDIRAYLDAGMPSREMNVSVHSVAQAVLLFLAALPEPLVPCSLYQAALKAADDGYAICKQVVDMMPDCHKTVFTYLIAFLNVLLTHSQNNKLDIKSLAMVFGLVILRESPKPGNDTSTKPEIDDKKKLFIYHFLVNE